MLGLPVSVGDMVRHPTLKVSPFGLLRIPAFQGSTLISRTPPIRPIMYREVCHVEAKEVAEIAFTT